MAVQKRPIRLIGILFIVLLCFGIAIILMGFSSNYQGNSAISTPTLIASKCSANSTPERFEAAEGFAAVFPCKPTRDFNTVSTIAGNITAVHYGVDLGHSYYDVLYSDYTPMLPGEATGLIGQIIQDRLQAATMDEYQVTFRSSNTIRQGNHEGRIITADDGERLVKIRQFIANKKLYRITVIVPITSPHEGDTFLDSLEISRPSEQ
jgi:hypothetical protein